MIDLYSLPTRKCIDCHEEKAIAIHFTPTRPSVCEDCERERKKKYPSSKREGPKDPHMAWNASRRGLKHGSRV